MSEIAIRVQGVVNDVKEIKVDFLLGTVVLKVLGAGVVAAPEGAFHIPAHVRADGMTRTLLVTMENPQRTINAPTPAYLKMVFSELGKAIRDEYHPVSVLHGNEYISDFCIGMLKLWNSALEITEKNVAQVHGAISEAMEQTFNRPAPVSRKVTKRWDVLSAKTIPELGKLVDDAFEDGWVPLGGMLIDAAGDGNYTTKPEPMYLQTIWLPPTPQQEYAATVRDQKQ